MESLQRRMESVVLGLPSGSYAQRVQVGGTRCLKALPVPLAEGVALGLLAGSSACRCSRACALLRQCGWSGSTLAASLPWPHTRPCLPGLSLFVQCKASPMLMPMYAR